MERPLLSTGQRIVVVLHALFAGALFVSGGLDSGGGDGASDLARFAVLFVVALYLLATATVTAAARYLTSGSVVRYALIVLGPPALMAVAVLIVRAA